MRWSARGRPYAINHMGIFMSHKKTDLPNGESDPAVSDAAATVDKIDAEQAKAPRSEAQTAPNDAAAQQAGSEESAHDELTGDNGADEVAALREALNQMSDEADRYRDQALRAAAEADNVRKRAQRDVESARKFALEKFAGELLAVRDSLEMGLQVGADQQADAGHLIEGMELTGRMLASAMEKFDIEQVNPMGEVFDPELHEAVSTQETDAQAPNTVTTVVQKGYTLNGRVLRAAMVVVARAPSA